MSEQALPLYYRENATPLDTTLLTDTYNGCMGVAGDPVPYQMRNDDVITLLMLLCFVLTIVSISHSHGFIGRQAKNLFRIHSGNETVVGETANEVRFQCFLGVQTFLLYSILQYLYTCEYIAETFYLDSPYELIAIYFFVICACQLFRGGLYTLVNNVFFDGKTNLQCLRSLLFLTAMEGVLLYPVVLLHVYFNTSFQSTIICFAFIFLFVKILTFYKCFSIFFGRIGSFLQIFLYFCALELIPLVSMWGILVITGNNLKVNF